MPEKTRLPASASQDASSKSTPVSGTMPAPGLLTLAQMEEIEDRCYARVFEELKRRRLAAPGRTAG